MELSLIAKYNGNYYIMEDGDTMMYRLVEAERYGVKCLVENGQSEPVDSSLDWEELSKNKEYDDIGIEECVLVPKKAVLPYAFHKEAEKEKAEVNTKKRTKKQEKEKKTSSQQPSKKVKKEEEGEEEWDGGLTKEEKDDILKPVFMSRSENVGLEPPLIDPPVIEPVPVATENVVILDE
jgi:hypothetical protein